MTLEKDQKKSKKNQYSYQISLLGRGVYKDWYLAVFLFILIFAITTVFSYFRSQEIGREIFNDRDEVLSQNNELEQEKIENLIQKYQNRKEVLNNFD